jgi:hypothetical protein
MNNWDRTYKCDEVMIDGIKSGAQVWTAIISGPSPRAAGSLDITVDSAHGHAQIRLSMTPQEMHDLAFNLNVHANRLKEFEAEVATLTKEAA